MADKLTQEERKQVIKAQQLAQAKAKRAGLVFTRKGQSKSLSEAERTTLLNRGLKKKKK